MAVHYDYIIVGAGAAGLSLAYYMSRHGPLLDKQVLIVDKADKNQNDRTWTFWGEPPADFKHLIHKSWHYIGLCDHYYSVQSPLFNQPYQYIPGHVFYNFTIETLKAHPNFHFLKENVEAIHTTRNLVTVTANGHSYTAEYVFNSAFKETTNLGELWDKIAFQRFKGWEVKYEQSVVDSDKITLMDFSASPDHDLQFMYMLPLASDRLIINYTAFGQQQLSPDVYEKRMQAYLKQRFGNKAYQITRHEGGLIPMSHLPLQRYYGDRVLNLGIMGGDTRASTGYTFIQALLNSQHIAYQLASGKAPEALEHKPRHAYYDRIFLHVLASDPQSLQKGLMQLFERNPASLVFRFLSGNTTIGEELPLIFSLPIKPFLKGLMQMLTKNDAPYAPRYRLSQANN